MSLLASSVAATEACLLQRGRNVAVLAHKYFIASIALTQPAFEALLHNISVLAN
jgi:hypothetical protein